MGTIDSELIDRDGPGPGGTMKIRVLENAERRDWLRLSLTDNVGPATFAMLMERYGAAEAAIEALPELARRGGRRIPLQVCSQARADDLIAEAERLGARLVAAAEPAYPPLLRAIETAPPLIWLKGNADLAARPAVALVGSRNASVLGLNTARTLARDLGQMGLVTVSGMARGIDTAIHAASLDTGTIAVLAGGIDNVYPPQNAGLYEAIADKGLLVSEMPPGQEPRAKHFPQRNRLVAGLALGTVIVEAAERSGSLITARLANENGREVFAVPGSPMDPRARGTNRLIRQGATLVAEAADIQSVLNPMIERVPPELNEQRSMTLAGPRPMPADEGAFSDDLGHRIIALLGASPTNIDSLIREIAAPAGAVQSALLELEVAGRLHRVDRSTVALV